MKLANEKQPKKLALINVLEVVGTRCLAGIDEDVAHIYLMLPYRGAWQLIRCDTKPEQLALRAFVPSEDGELVHALIEAMQPLPRTRKKSKKKAKPR